MFDSTVIRCRLGQFKLASSDQIAIDNLGRLEDEAHRAIRVRNDKACRLTILLLSL